MRLMGYNWAKHNMTHKIRIVSLLMVSAMLFFAGCKKNNSENETNEINETPEETFVEQIPEEILQLLDNCPSVNYQDPSVFGYNGKSKKPLDNLFGAMCNVAMRLTNDTKYEAGNDPDKEEPEQNGLAYVYGYGHLDDKNDSNHYSEIKDYRKRRRGYNSKCDDKYLHGIDCAGFIAHVMDSVGIKGKKKSLFQMKAWEQVEYFKSLKRLKTSQYTGLVKVEEFENISVSDIKNGDILYRIQAKDNDTATHIGIVFKRPEDADWELTMFQSSGDPKNDCEHNLHENDHGPIQKKLNNKNLNKYFEVVNGHSGYARVLRITADTNWVDLGLESGILWSTRNAVVNSPEEFGYYITWDNLASAEAEANLAWIEPEGTPYSGIFGCHTPTKEDWQELINNVPSEWKTQNGVKGRLFTASNGNKLFLPAAGFLHEGNIYNTGQYADLGFYWTSTPSENNPNNAYYVRFNSNPDEKPVLAAYLRLFGLSVRPVRSFP